MNLTQQERTAHDTAVKQEALRAAKAYFTGAGSFRRITVFIRGSLIRSIFYAVGYAALTCFVAVAAITIGYDHERGLAEFRTWILSMSPDQLTAKAHELSVYFGFEALRAGLFAGFIHQIILVVKRQSQMDRMSASPEQGKNDMSRLDKFQSLCVLADRFKQSGQHGDVADISNQIAREIMGWHVDPLDSHRLWRDSTGSVVTVNFFGEIQSVCMHPWVDGINAPDETSFSPGHNYHANRHDWRKWVIQNM